LQYMMPFLQTNTFQNVTKPGQQGAFGDILGAAATIGSALLL